MRSPLSPLLTLLLMMLVGPIQADQPTPDNPGYWLDRANATIPHVPEPAEQAALYARMAEIYAWVGPLMAYEQALTKAEAALAQAGAEADDRVVRDARWAGIYLIDPLVTAGELPRAWKLAQTAAQAMELSAWVPFKEYASALARRGNLEAALAVTDHVKEVWRGEVLVAIIKGLCEREDLASAERVAQTIPEEDRSRRGQAFEAIARTLARLGQAEQAWTMAERVPYDTTRLRTYGRIAEILAQLGDDEAAHATVQAMLKPEQAKPGTWEEAAHMALVYITRAQLKRQAFEAAQQTIERIKGGWKATAQRDLAQALVEAGKLDEARRIVLPMKAGQERDDTLRRIVVALAREGRIDEAPELAQAASEPGDLLASIAKAVLDQGREKEALEIVEAALGGAPAIPGDDWSPRLNLENLAIRIQSGDEAALDHAVQRHQEWLQVSADMDKSSILFRLAFLHLLKGDDAAAKQAMDGLSDDVQPFLIAMAISAMRGQEQYSARVRALLPLVPESQREEFLSSVATVHLELDRAQELVNWLDGLPDPAERAQAYLLAAWAARIHR